MEAGEVEPPEDVEAAATRYGGPDFRIAEERRDAEQKARITCRDAPIAEEPLCVF